MSLHSAGQISVTEGRVRPVLILHGLLMRRPGLLPIAWRLKQRGFTPVLFSYSTLWQSPDLAMEQLARRLAAFGDGPAHLLAHSLGGLVAAETLNRHPDVPVGLERAILKCIEREPDKRYLYLSVLVRDLKAALYV